MLEHQMKVLEGVSGNRELFLNELTKSKSWLSQEELSQLEIWLKKKFGFNYLDEIKA